MDRTLTLDDSSRPARPMIKGLCRVLSCDAIRHEPQWTSLSDVDEVLFTRGPGSAAVLGRVLTISIDDARVSRPHARLRLHNSTVQFEDLGSKNGSYVDGVSVSIRCLAEGAVIEIGRTYFVLRTLDHEELRLLPRRLLAPALPIITTCSPVFSVLLQTLARVATSNAPVLLTGETGTGKEVLAKRLHALSGRSGAFVAVNCGALPRELVEAELFGAKKGAYSGSLADRPGLVRSAAGGTLLLDEIGDLPMAAQAALLRVLQERSVLAVGATTPVEVDFRLLSATHKDLDAEVAAGRFRPDLKARLSGLVLHLPPLRERKEDIGLLLNGFLPKGLLLTNKAARVLMTSSWPGNIRELERAVEAAVALSAGAAVDLEHLPGCRQGPANESLPPLPSAEVSGLDNDPIDDELRQRLTSLLLEHKGNVSAVARVLGKKRMQVYRWVERCGLEPTRFR